MKKTYIIPALYITRIRVESMIAESYAINDNSVSVDRGGFVKGESSSPSRYNVWDDDWSAN